MPKTIPVDQPECCLVGRSEPSEALHHRVECVEVGMFLARTCKIANDGSSSGSTSSCRSPVIGEMPSRYSDQPPARFGSFRDDVNLGGRGCEGRSCNVLGKCPLVSAAHYIGEDRRIVSAKDACEHFCVPLVHSLRTGFPIPDLLRERPYQEPAVSATGRREAALDSGNQAPRLDFSYATTATGSHRGLRPADAAIWDNKLTDAADCRHHSGKGNVGRRRRNHSSIG